jgi:hypothetical protein
MSPLLKPTEMRVFSGCESSVGASLQWSESSVGTSAGVMRQLACVQSRALQLFCIRREIAPLTQTFFRQPYLSCKHTDSRMQKI